MSIPLPPTNFLCPLSNKLMKHPVTLGDSSQDGSVLQPSFERSAVLSQIEEASQSFQCPVTGRSISSDCLLINKTLQWKIKYWVKKNYGSFETANAAIANQSRSASSLERNFAPCITTKMTTTTRPSHFYCPLSKQIMQDPVHAPASIVNYERQEILKWLDAADDETCPVSGRPLQRKSLVRNVALADEIDAWYKQHQHQNTLSLKSQADNTPPGTIIPQHGGLVPLLDCLPLLAPSGAQPTISDRDRLNNLLSMLDEAVECCD